MKALILLILSLALSFTACSKAPDTSASVPDAVPAAADSPPAAPATPVTHLDAPGASALLKKNSAVTVLDVRTPDEYAQGHLAGAVNIDFRSQEFRNTVSAQLNKEEGYLLHCRSGGRSSAALEILEGLGFGKLYHLDGGITAWTDAGLPVEK